MPWYVFALVDAPPAKRPPRGLSGPLGLRRVGDAFLLGTTSWRIESIEPDRVLVVPAEGAPGVVPFWRGETTGRSFDSDFAMVSAIKNGRIARFQEFTNSAAVNAAFAPVGAGV